MPNAIIEVLKVKQLSACGAVSYRDFINKISQLPDEEVSESLASAKTIDQLAEWGENGISLLTILSPNYPALLREIPAPPPLLYYRGQAAILDNYCVAVVGSRNCDAFGGSIAEELGAAIAEAGITVVSGLALGIDGAAHRGALRIPDGGGTIAVLGNGIDNIYPKKHLSLGEEILDSNGLLISQFPPGTPPYPKNFLERNQIIAGLCTHTVVVQAAVRSGALVTARLAAEFGREVFAVPGAVSDPRHAGTLQLIKTGAGLILGAEDLLNELGAMPKPNFEVSPLSPGAAELLAVLKQHGRMVIEELQISAGIEGFHSTLLELESAGHILLLPGNQVTVTST